MRAPSEKIRLLQNIIVRIARLVLEDVGESARYPIRLESVFFQAPTKHVIFSEQQKHTKTLYF